MTDEEIIAGLARMHKHLSEMHAEYGTDIVSAAAARIAALGEALAKSRAHLGFIATHLTTDEGDKDETEEDFGLEMSEVVEMAHDNLIGRARYACDEIDKFNAASGKIIQNTHPTETR